jgi:hypothetical protein
MPKDGTTLPHPFATYCVGWFLSVSGHREIAYRALLNLFCSLGGECGRLGTMHNGAKPVPPAADLTRRDTPGGARLRQHSLLLIVDPDDIASSKSELSYTSPMNLR